MEQLRARRLYHRWLPVAANFSEVNVQAERDDPLSMLTLYRRLIRLRRDQAALAHGASKPLCVQGDAFVYLRQAKSRCLLVALNMGCEPCAILLESRLRGGRVLLSTHLDREAGTG